MPIVQKTKEKEKPYASCGHLVHEAGPFMLNLVLYWTYNVFITTWLKDTKTTFDTGLPPLNKTNGRSWPSCLILMIN